MGGIEELRRQINAIDEQLVRLLDERAEVAIKVGEWKKKEGRPAFDSARQRWVLDNLGKMCRVFPPEGLRNVFTEIMSSCRSLEEATRIAFLGPEATFSHQAATDEFGASGEFLPVDRISAIFDAVEKGRAHYGVVPIENSTGGVVYETLDRFIDSPLKICAERTAVIELHLLANCPLSEVEAVYSHPQPLQQCREWLQMHLPNAKRVETDSTVRGAEAAAAEPRAAAIAGELAAKRTGLRIVERGVQDMRNNMTRFWVIGRDTAHATGNDKTSVLFFLRDRPGALYAVLGHLAETNINMTRIESRPSRRARWQYAFFVDFLGHHEDEDVQKALEKLEECCEEVRVLGSYPRDENS